MKSNRNLIAGTVIVSFVIILGYWLFTAERPSEEQQVRTSRLEGKENAQDDVPNNSSENESSSGLEVNFFLENSGSMDGYLKSGTSLFVKDQNRLLRDLELESLPINTFYVNTEVYPSQKDLDQFLNTMNVSGIQEYGNRGNSDINFMFSQAIKKSGGGRVSILVSDGIYSLLETGKANIVNALQTEKFKTRKEIVEAAKSNDLMTVLVKMESNFNGNYFTAAGETIRINQTRPYYMWFFGSREDLGIILGLLNVSELEGYVNQARFIRSVMLEIPYTLLTTGKEKIGEFRSDRNRSGDDIRELINCERADRGENKGSFGFGLAVDFSEVLIADSYISSPENYKIEPDSYEISRIEKVIDGNRPRSFRSLSFEPTHVISLKSETSFLGEYEVILDNSVPDWISMSGNLDDSNIIGDTRTTFGFQVLIEGITEAYKKLNDDQIDLAKFSIKIKP